MSYHKIHCIKIKQYDTSYNMLYCDKTIQYDIIYHDKSSDLSQNDISYRDKTI